jgi:hypothetical protein
MWDDYKKKRTVEQELTAKELFENQNMFDFRACGIVYMGNEFTGFYKIEQNGENINYLFLIQVEDFHLVRKAILKITVLC